MQAYGYEVGDAYARGDEQEEGPLHLREVTLSCTVEDLRRVQRFVTEVLAKHPAMGPLDHEHFRDRDPDWTDEESDFIIVKQA